MPLPRLTKNTFTISTSSDSWCCEKHIDVLITGLLVIIKKCNLNLIILLDLHFFLNIELYFGWIGQNSKIELQKSFVKWFTLCVNILLLKCIICLLLKKKTFFFINKMLNLVLLNHTHTQIGFLPGLNKKKSQFYRALVDWDPPFLISFKI